jgi:hypothetical protein
MDNIAERRNFIAAMKDELPDGLKCLLFMYDWLSGGKPRTAEEDMEDWLVGTPLEEIFRIVGLPQAVWPNEELVHKTSNGKVGAIRRVQQEKEDDYG